MIKKILLIICFIFILGGCSLKNKDINKIYLDSKYYNKGEYISVNSDDINNIKNQNYVLFVYNNYCSFNVPCDVVFLEFMKKNNIDFLSIPFDEFKKTMFYNSVKYAPSVLIIENGKVLKYLDAENDQDIKKYEDAIEFEKWISDYIYLKVINN